jgi:hypothetical protein
VPDTVPASALRVGSLSIMLKVVVSKAVPGPAWSGAVGLLWITRHLEGRIRAGQYGSEGVVIATRRKPVQTLSGEPGRSTSAFHVLLMSGRARNFSLCISRCQSEKGGVC